MTTTVLDGSPPGRTHSMRDFAWTTLKHHSWFTITAGIYVLSVVVLLTALNRPFKIFDSFYVITALLPPLVAAFAVVLGQVVYHLLHVRPFSLQGLVHDLRADDKLRPRRMIYAGIPILAVIAFQSAFTSFKSSITVLNPFEYDLAFMEFDQLLHFGTHPWQWLQPILGYPIVTSVVSYTYKLWYGVFYLIFFWMAFSMRDPVLRIRYLLSYLLSWILIGSVAALLLSSAGPCFYGYVVEGPNPYAALMAYLSDAEMQYKNWSLFAQDYLWEAYQRQEALEIASGISAMPSMHVAIAALQALLGWKISRRAGIILTAYCVIIMIGSVHLGWHYAIDGYVSILAVVAIWKGVGWALRFHPSFGWAEGDGASEETAEAAPAR